MIVSLDQVNALAKSKYKNYMITVQSADSMMLSDLAEEEDILATSIPNPIEKQLKIQKCFGGHVYDKGSIIRYGWYPV